MSLRALPPVQRLLESPLLRDRPRAAAVAALRHAIDAARTILREGGNAPTDDALIAEAIARLDAEATPRLRRVINATGIVLHTNLGRAPLADAAIAAAAAAGGYCTLEFDLATGARGHRTQGIEPLLRGLVGAEAGIAVNNCAAALLLALSALADGGEVIVSRGELVEIGGGFRIPDVIRQGGARLVEIGTTNKTRLADYAAAITPATRILLKIHQSNFRMTGFTEATGLAELSTLARAENLLLVHDLGSGAVTDLRRLGRPAEIMVQESVMAGADVVAFSGDKLLGGPQAGILVGRADPIDRLRRHPLMRALRLDKLSLAALEATLRLHADGATDQIPALRMMAQTPATLRARAERLAAAIGAGDIVPSTGFAGGGTMPDAGIPSLAVAIAAADTERLKAALRDADPPVIARIAEGHLLLDLLTLDDADFPDIARAVREATP